MIAIITHKDNMSFTKKGYSWLHVGTHVGHKEDYLYDDTGVNISHLNKWYAELTGIYWLWKNNHDDIKGIVHYRRFFSKNPFCGHEIFFYSEEEIRKCLKKADLVVPCKYYLAGGNNYNNYKLYHNSADIDLLRKIFVSEFSDYVHAFDAVMEKKYLYPFNMFITSAKIFDEYCSWLFDVIGKSKKYYNLTDYTGTQSRIYGFLGERLFNIWLEKNKPLYVEKWVVQTDSKVRERVKRYIETKLKIKIGFGLQ